MGDSGLLITLGGWPGGSAGAKRDAAGDQRGEIGRIKTDAWRGLAVVLDVGKAIRPAPALVPVGTVGSVHCRPGAVTVRRAGVTTVPTLLLA